MSPCVLLVEADNGEWRADLGVGLIRSYQGPLGHVLRAMKEAQRVSPRLVYLLTTEPTRARLNEHWQRYLDSRGITLLPSSQADHRPPNRVS